MEQGSSFYLGRKYIIVHYKTKHIGFQLNKSSNCNKERRKKLHFNSIPKFPTVPTDRRENLHDDGL